MINRNNACQFCSHILHQGTEAWGTTVTDKGLVCWNCVSEYGDASSIFYALGTTQSVSGQTQYRYRSVLPGGIIAELSFFDATAFKRPPQDCIGRAIDVNEFSGVPADVVDILQRLAYFKFRVLSDGRPGGSSENIFDYSHDDELTGEERRNLGLRRLAAYEAGGSVATMPRKISLGRGYEVAPGKPVCVITVEIEFPQ